MKSTSPDAGHPAKSIWFPATRTPGKVRARWGENSRLDAPVMKALQVIAGIQSSGSPTGAEWINSRINPQRSNDKVPFAVDISVRHSGIAR